MFDFQLFVRDSRSLKCVLGYGLGGFSVVCGCSGRVSMDPERVNHMPFCWNLAGNQMEQNHDGHLVQVLNVRR